MIAAINGVAVGAGAVIAAACDLRIASDRSRFGFIFPKVGLCGADMGASYLLPKIVGRGRAAQILYFGDLFGADEALNYGFVNRVVETEQVLPMARQWAGRLAKGPGFAHAMTKQMIVAEENMSLAEAIEAEAQAQAIAWLIRTSRGLQRQQGKAEPRFQGAPD